MSNENIHKNHRQRMRDKFEKIGFKGWSDFEILEYMLYNVYRQGDTNPTAHRILEYGAGSIVNVLENACDSLMQENVPNVGEKTVLFLRSLKEFIDYYRIEEIKYKSIKMNRGNMRKIINYTNFSRSKEGILLICADVFLNITAIVDITENNGCDFAESSPERIVKAVSGEGAKFVSIVHNHPSGDLNVSVSDIVFTETVTSLLQNMNMELIDHVIMTPSDVVSIKAYVTNENIRNNSSMYDDTMVET